MTIPEALNLVEQFVSDELDNRARCFYVKTEYVTNARRALAAVQFLRKNFAATALDVSDTEDEIKVARVLGDMVSEDDL